MNIKRIFVKTVFLPVLFFISPLFFLHGSEYKLFDVIKRSELHRFHMPEEQEFVVSLSNGVVSGIAFFLQNYLPINLPANSKAAFTQGTTPMPLLVSLQVDGKIVTSVYYKSNFYLLRYNSNGTVDTTFGEDGLVTTVLGAGAIVNAISPQTDGKLLAAGSVIYQEQSKSFFIRYNIDGTIDQTFGTNGFLIVTSSVVSSINVITTDSNNIIYAAGLSGNKFLIVSLNTDGSFNQSFGINGITTTAIGSLANALTLNLQQDGNIVVGGLSDNNYAVARYMPNGQLDTSFATNGIFKKLRGIINAVRSIALQSDGKIVCGGFADTTLSIFRLNTDGTLDQSFANGTVATISVGMNAQALGVFLLPTGKILLSGFADNKNIIICYTGEGILDRAFGTNGVLTDADITALMDCLATGNCPVYLFVSTTNNYLFIYDTMSQVIARPNVYQNVTFNTHAIIDGWIPSGDEPEFTCQQSGLYFVMYTAEVDNILLDEGTIEIVIFADNQEVIPSRSIAGIGRIGVPVVVSKSFLHTFPAGQTIKMQIKASHDGVRIEGSTETTAIPSVSLTIVHIK